MLAVEKLEARTVTETFDDWSVTYRVIPITENVELLVYDESNDAVLSINGAEIEFTWTEVAAAMFDNIAGINAVELLGLLAQLNLKMESDMLTARQARQDAPQPDWDCLTLEHEPALEKSLDGMVHRATASDEEGNRYIVTWSPDINGHCNWDNPSEVLAI